MLPGNHNNNLLATDILLPVSFGSESDEGAVVAGYCFGYGLSAVVYVAFLFDFRLEFIQEGEEL